MSFNTRILTNPFTLYGVSILITLIIFELKWSQYYDHIGIQLLCFYIITTVISFVLSFTPIIKRKNIFKPIKVDRKNKIYFYIIFLGYLFEFAYCKSIPIITVTIGGVGNYRDFTGIPTFHVLLFCLSLFWAIYVFVQFQSQPKNRILKRYVLFSYVPYILLLNRGAIMTLLICSLFIYLLRIKKLDIRKLMYFCVFTILFFLMFGIAGNARDSAFQKDDTYILRLGGATEEFKNSSIPKSLFWGYLYIASPVGNVQNAVEHAEISETTIDDLKDLIVCCFLPDFMSKKLQDGNEEVLNTNSRFLVTPILNAPSLYFLPYLIYGWFGMILAFIYSILMIYVYAKIVPLKSKYFLVGWSMMLSTIVLNNFNNMWYFNGILMLMFVCAIEFISEIKNLKNRNTNG